MESRAPRHLSGLIKSVAQRRSTIKIGKIWSILQFKTWKKRGAKSKTFRTPTFSHTVSGAKRRNAQKYIYVCARSAETLKKYIDVGARSAETLKNTYTFVREALKRSKIHRLWCAKRRNFQQYTHFGARSAETLNNTQYLMREARKRSEKYIHCGAREAPTRVPLEGVKRRNARKYMHGGGQCVRE